MREDRKGEGRKVGRKGGDKRSKYQPTRDGMSHAAWDSQDKTGQTHESSLTVGGPSGPRKAGE